jgi:hypothetical protein
LAKAYYVAQTAAGETVSAGECEVAAHETGITLSPPTDAPLNLRYEQIVHLEGTDYRIAIALEDGTAVELSRLGTMFGDLLRQVRDGRNEAWERGLFLHGVNRVDAFPCEIVLADGPCNAELRVYEDRFSVLPERGDPFGFPYAFVQGATLDESTYRVTVGLSGRDGLVVGKLKQRTTELPGLLNDLLAALRTRTATVLADYLPGLSALKLQALARLMVDGVAARREDIEAIDGTIWSRLEKVVAATGELAETYRFLAAMASVPDVAIGLKQIRWSEEKNLSEDGDGEASVGGESSQDDASQERASAEESAEGEASKSPLVTWFFCPIPTGGAVKSDFIAQEITSEAGHATYFFRVEPGVGWREALIRLNQAMLALDFRRRPIFRSEDHLGRDPYAFAVRHLPCLRALRESFAGRAIHTSLEAWKASVESIVRASPDVR